VANMTGQHIILLGCGKMGSALLRGWLADSALEADFTIIEPYDDAVAWLPQLDNLRRYSSVSEAASAAVPKADFVLLAVKPQMMADAASDLKSLSHDMTAYLSIAAGLSCDWLSNHLGAEAAILRSMPNTPAAIGKGITALYANMHVRSEQRAFASQLLRAVGVVVDLPNETLMDAVTALSGSGPAYIFHMAEAMAAAGEQLGLSEALAHQLARQTIAGAGALLEQSDEAASTLRETVTSKGGTTAAALSVLQSDNGLHALLMNAMQAAYDRSKELGA